MIVISVENIDITKLYYDLAHKSWSIPSTSMINNITMFEFMIHPNKYPIKLIIHYIPWSTHKYPL